MAERLIGMLIFPRLTQLDMTGPYEGRPRRSHCCAAVAPH
jgi:hypothetical protein